MATNAREARRKKILERGSDRLAFITGRVDNLPSSSSEAHDASSQPLVSDQNYQNSVAMVSSSGGEDKLLDPTFLDHNPVSDACNSHQRDLPPFQFKNEANTQLYRSPTSEGGSEAQPAPVSSVGASGTEQQSRRQIKDFKVFTASQISYAVTASERSRFSCSVAVALIVVLSYLGLPCLSGEVMNMISFRPLFLVLLTNLTIVVVHLLSDKQRSSRRMDRGEAKLPTVDGYGWAEQLSKTLEAGMVMQKVMDALFMDCGVYAIIVVCGLSLQQIFSK